MSVMMTLAERKQFRGIFTQRKILWGILEKIQGLQPSMDMNEIQSLVIQSDSGKIVSTTGSDKHYTKCTYPNLCSIMRTSNKVAIHDANTFEPVFAIWQSEPNLVFGEDEKNTSSIAENKDKSIVKDLFHFNNEKDAES